MKAFVAALFFMSLWSCTPAHSQDCPPDKTCKTIMLTAEQEQMLDQLVTNSCLQGPYAQVHQVVQFYKDLLAKAPRIEPKSEPKK